MISSAKQKWYHFYLPHRVKTQMTWSMGRIFGNIKICIQGNLEVVIIVTHGYISAWEIIWANSGYKCHIRTPFSGHPTPRDSNSVDLRYNIRIQIFKLPRWFWYTAGSENYYAKWILKPLFIFWSSVNDAWLFFPDIWHPLRKI